MTESSKLIYRGDYNTSGGSVSFMSSDYEYLYVKHNGGSHDNRLFWTIEPNTRYTLTATALSADPTVVGGIKIYLSLTRDNYLPSGD